MTKKDQQYEAWLADIKNRQPILNNPEALTDSIFHAISQTNALKRKRRLYSFGAWISGAAAICLFVILIYDASFQPERQTHIANLPTESAHSLPDRWNEMKLSEKTTYIYTQYKQRRERQVYLSQFINNPTK